MRKIIFLESLLALFLLISIASVSAVQLDKETIDPEYSFTLSVDKTSLGYIIETELVYINGEENYLMVGDTGCNIYNGNDELVWTSYEDEGPETGIGKGSKITTTNIWTKTDSERDYVEPGTYKIMGVAGFYEDDECTETFTEPQFVDIEKIKTKNVFLSFLFKFFKPIFSF